MSFGGSSLGAATGFITIETAGSEKNIKALGGLIDGLDAKTAGFGNASNIGKAFAGLGASILGGLGIAVNTAANFEQRMSAVQAVTGATGKEFDALSNKALQLGKDTQFSATEAASAIEELAKAGVSTKDILAGAADGAVALAAAAGVDLPTAAIIMSNTLNEFQLDGTNAAHVADLLAAAANKSAADVTDLGEALSYVGTTAHTLNISADDTVAAIAVLSDNGIKGSRAGTSLASALNNIIAPTDKVQTELDALGISVVDQNGAFVGLTSVIKQTYAATKDMTDAQRQAALTTVFGERGARAMTALLQTQNDEAKKAGKSWEEYQAGVETANAAQDAAAARMDNLKGSIEQLRGSIETVLIRIGEIFLPVVRKIVDGATAIANAVLGLPQPVIKAAAAIAGLVGALASGVGLFILFEPKIRKFIKTFNEIKPALAGILGPALGVAAGFALIGLAYNKNFAGIKDKIGAVTDAIKKKIGDITGVLKQFRAGIDEVLSIRHGDAFGVLANVFDLAGRFENLGVGAEAARKMAFAVDNLRLPLTRVINDLLSVNNAAGAFVDILFGGGTQTSYEKLAKAAQYLFGKNVGKQFVQATAQMRVALKGVGDAFKAATGIDVGKLLTWPGIFTAITNAGAKLSTWIDRGFIKLGPPLVAMLQASTRAFDFLSLHMASIVGTTRDIASAIKDDLGGALSVVGNLLTGDFSGAWDAFTGLMSDLFSQTISIGSVAIDVLNWVIGGAVDLYDQIKLAAYKLTGGNDKATHVPIGDVIAQVERWIVGGVTDLYDRIKTYAYKLVGGDGSAQNQIAAKTGQGGIPLGDVAVAVGSWLVGGALDLVDTIKTKALSLIGPAVKLGTIAVDGALDLGGALLSVSQRFGAWIAGKLTAGWDRAVPFGAAVLTGAFSLGSKIGDFGGWLWGQLKAGWTGAVSFGKATLSGAYALGSKLGDVGAWIWGQLKGNWAGAVSFGKATLDGAYALAEGAADKAAGIVKAVLHGHVITVNDWKVNLNVPSGDNITVDTKGVWDAVFKVLNYSPTFSPDQLQSAQNIGHTAGVSTKDAIVQGFADALNGKGGGKAAGSLADVPGHGASAQAPFGDLVNAVIQGYLGGFAFTGSPGDIALATALNETADKIQTRLSNFNPFDAPAEKPKKADPKPLVDFGDLVSGIWNFKSDTTWSSLLKPLDDQLQGASDAVAGWLNKVPDKIMSAIGLGPSGGAPAMATGFGGPIGGPISGGAGSMSGAILDKIKGLFGDGADIAAGVLKALDTSISGTISAVSGWFSDLPGKIMSAIGLGPGGGAPAMATGAGFAIGGASGNPIGSAITDFLTPDLSGIGFPSLPDWVSDPMGKIPGLNGLLGKLADGAGLVQAAWDKIFGVNDSQGGHKVSGGAHNPAPGTFGPLPTSAPAVPAPVAVQPEPKITPAATGTPTPSGLVYNWTKDQVKAIPAVTATVPLSIVFKKIDGGGSDPMARNKPDGGAGTTQVVTTKFMADDSDVAIKYTDVSTWGAAWAASSFSGTFLGNNADVAVKYTDVMTWAGLWAAQTPSATFLADDGDVAIKYTDVFTWGDAWGAATFTGTFAGDNGPAAIAYTDAFTWGDIWAQQVFTARFSIDTSGLTAAVGVAYSAAAAIAAIMPHSPAKKGPLKEPITFDYIADNMRVTAKRLKSYANDSARVLANAFGAQPTTAAQFAAAQVNTAGGGGGASTTVNQYALSPADLMRVLEQSGQGASAYSWIGQAHG